MTASHTPKSPAGTPSAAGRVLRLLGHRWPTWLALALVAVTFIDGSPPLTFLAALLIVMPLCYLGFGALRAELRRPGVLALQTAGLLAFATLAPVALLVDRTAGHYVVAAGWFAHAVWDLAHHRAGRVVPRAWSEWCGVVDLFGAAAIALSA
ncbi:hypothetical protein [Streptomyces sp. SP18CS02]|uniref:hypothetical protein n=1 Tax=Streptomyces sp. SP18CS02 TaxID=3002531 RepID=UPI002E79B29F|nr:hypothetical protein [Streptomyces sp. SP18CS02]MEE1753103.1 hypothetical protein [Streptomyces sp. SP18CS02]